MKPYYEDDFATIYHGDCMEVVAEVDAAQRLSQGVLDLGGAA